MQTLDALFAAHMHLIDEQDNFFDVEFMTSYISYMLLKNMREQGGIGGEEASSHDIVPLIEHSDDDGRLIKRIARDIFLQSENEPCGLKGCRLAVYVESLEGVRYMHTQFKFDATSSMTTFELSLVIKQQQIFSNECALPTSTTTWGRRWFGGAASEQPAKSAKSQQQQQHQQAKKIFGLEPFSYEIFKCKLY